MINTILTVFIIYFILYTILSIYIGAYSRSKYILHIDYVLKYILDRVDCIAQKLMCCQKIYCDWNFIPLWSCDIYVMKPYLMSSGTCHQKRQKLYGFWFQVIRSSRLQTNPNEVSNRIRCVTSFVNCLNCCVPYCTGVSPLFAHPFSNARIPKLRLYYIMHSFYTEAMQ